MITDLAERAKALDPSASFIVQAPAGSGKTGLLVQRFLRLLATVDRPESVIAITFTRKAAAEMRARILEALEAAGDQDELGDEFTLQLRELAREALSRDRQLGWNLLANSDRLQIQTIDSLCAALIRQAPVSSGFGGGARVVENADAFYRTAARNTLRSLANGTASDGELLARLGVYFDSDFAGLQSQIARMLAQRDGWRFADREHDSLTADFCKLLGLASDALEQVFQGAGTVDFTAITLAAIRLLGTPDRPSDLLYWLDYRIAHLLVDEFQDTSLAQYELIKGLTAQWSEGDGHTLFLVGDPMQSIYGFRGAEVSLFLQTWKDESLGAVRFQRLTLQTNFRTTPEILGWVQERFRPIMEEDEAGGVRFRSSVAARPSGAKKPLLKAFVSDEGSREANEVAVMAKAALLRGTVAILVRSRPHLAKILPGLREAGLRYEAVEIDLLSEEQHILDLVSLTRAIIHVGDRTAWLACLRAPWSGFSLSDLTILAEDERERTICDLLSDPEKIAALSVEGREFAIRTGDVLRSAVAQAGRVPLRDLIEKAWLQLGGPAILQFVHQREDVETYFGLLEELQNGGVLPDLAILEERLALLFARAASGENFVQVMTVHQAKGLEFDTVILPHLEGNARALENELLLWDEQIAEDGSTRFRVAAQPRKGDKTSVYDSVRDSRKAKELHELKRLFYVACTRAKNELYLLGNAKTKQDGTDVARASSNSFLGLIWNVVEQDFQSTLRNSLKQISLFEAERPRPVTVVRRLPAQWKLPRFARAVLWKPEYEQSTASTRKISYDWASDVGRHVGTLVHALLRQAAEQSNPLSVSNGAASAYLPMIHAELLRLGVSRDAADDGVQRVMKAFQNVLKSERGRWILEAKTEAKSEWAIGGRLGDKLISGTIDRAFRDVDGRFWIIDYKTSEHQGAKRERFLQEEKRRYLVQMENYGALIANTVGGPIWLGLYFPLLDAWIEWQCAEQTVGAGYYTDR